MNFASDNVAGAAPEILEAIARASAGSVPSYGADPLTAQVEARFAELFERRVAVFPVATGSAANALALAAAVPPWGVAYCHRAAHVNTDECGAPEFFTAGAKLIALDGDHGKLSAAALSAAVAGQAGNVHHAQPAALSLTQATEAGTIYQPREVAALSEVARAHTLAVHMDGARFANALATLGCTPAAATWRAGVDILSFGATKNGALAAEAIIVFRDDLAETLALRRKRAGHLFSKMRLISAQLDASLDNGNWLRWAGHANAQAVRLARGLVDLPGVALLHPVEANEVFAALPEPVVAGLERLGFGFYRWAQAAGRVVIRLVTAFDTDPADVDRLLAAAAALSGSDAAEAVD